MIHDSGVVHIQRNKVLLYTYKVLIQKDSFQKLCYVLHKIFILYIFIILRTYFIQLKNGCEKEKGIEEPFF